MMFILFYFSYYQIVIVMIGIGTSSGFCYVFLFVIILHVKSQLWKLQVYLKVDFKNYFRVKALVDNLENMGKILENFIEYVNLKKKKKTELEFEESSVNKT